ncbi:hypothetical protein K3495_g7750 [Podosphaera aphanis]|nr:hypothetical protein K3495_g7750 [Podosphaera aphanis]
MEVPDFSDGWLRSFKKRHGIKSRPQHGEDGSVNEAAVAQQRAQVHELATEYHPDDIYNCDESGLFWKMTPERGLSTNPDKLPIWLIGTSANPRCFGSAGINIGAFNGVWKSNGKAWMTADLMVECLEYFAHRIGGDRNVLLIMDNFSAHVSEYQKIQQSLSHNVTAWNSVTELTIKNCWSKTKILPIEHQPTFDLQAAEEARVLRLVAQLEQEGRIQHVILIDNLPNSEAEVVEDVLNHEDPEEQIVELFDAPIMYESTVEEKILPSITGKQALEALNTLHL